MAIITFNPYPQIGTQLTAGLDAVSGALTPASTVDEFVNAIYNYIQPIYYPVSGGLAVPKQTEIEIKSVVYNIINAYSDKVINQLPWTDQQLNFASMMLGLTTTNNTPINALAAWFSDIQDNISDANQPIDEQTPLLLAIQSGISIYAYWNTKIAAPGTWTPFFQTPAALNYANIPLWTAACMEGALIGANASQKGLIAPTTDIVSVNIISSLIGALTIGAGKVIFKWVPEILPMALVEGSFIGGFSPALGGSNTGPQSLLKEGDTNNSNCSNPKKCNISNTSACSVFDCKNTCNTCTGK